MPFLEDDIFPKTSRMLHVWTWHNSIARWKKQTCIPLMSMLQLSMNTIMKYSISITIVFQIQWRNLLSLKSNYSGKI